MHTEPPSRGLRKYLHEKGIGMKDLPKAVVIYEGRRLLICFKSLFVCKIIVHILAYPLS